MLSPAGRREGLSAQPALERFGLAQIGDFPVGYLSAGQKRRVALARLFVAPVRSGFSTSRRPRSTSARRSALAEAMARASRRRRHDHRRDPCAARPDRRQRTAPRRVRARLDTAGACMMRSRFWLCSGANCASPARIGGGGAMGVVFFLILVSLTPFAIGPDLNLLSRDRPGDSVDRRAAGDAARPRPAVSGRRRRRFARPVHASASTPLELVVLVKCAAHWMLTGLPLVVAAPLLGLMLGAGAAGAGRRRRLAAGGHAGADLARRDRRGADRRPAARRAVDGGADPAAAHAGADFRRLGGGGRQRRHGAVLTPLADSVRACRWSPSPARPSPRRRLCARDD